MTKTHYVHANHQAGGWDVMAEGEFEPIRHFGAKAEAVHFARYLSEVEHSELVVYDEQDRIETKDDRWYNAEGDEENRR